MMGRHDPLRDDFTALDELEREVHRPVRRPASLIVPILITMIVMTGGVTIAWYSYNAGIKEGSESAAPLLKPSGPMKVAPENPGGTKIPHQEMTVYQSPGEKSETGQVERILPPPEQPLTPPAAAEPSGAAGGESSRMRSADTVGGAPAETGAPKTPDTILPPLGGAAPRTLVPLVPKDPQVALAAPKAPSRDVRAAEVKPVDRPAERPAKAEPARKAETPQVAAIPSGAYRVQLGSVSSEGQATKFWSAQQDKNDDLLGKLALNVERATVGGKTYYRIQAGPLGDADSARSLCDQLKRRQVGCIIVNPKN
jgi:septal ring-binding cell division protein DamX